MPCQPALSQLVAVTVAQGALDVALSVAFGDVLAAVIVFLTTRKRNIDFGTPVDEVELGRDAG